jgi:hypothetical protein
VIDAELRELSKKSWNCLETAYEKTLSLLKQPFNCTDWLGYPKRKKGGPR